MNDKENLSQDITVTFCGHGDTSITPDLTMWLTNTIEAQIEAGATQFYLGGYGAFDRAAASVVWKLKEKYPHITSTLVLPYLDHQVDASHYDDTTYPSLENVPRRFAILRRNEWMVDVSDVVIASVDHGWGGAAQTLTYAIKKHKTIFNYSSWTP